ncbi:MAG: DUF6689 family protein [Rudaea sp.]
MKTVFDILRNMRLASFALTGLLFAVNADATVTVSVNGNVATALVELPDSSTPTYAATVTITFDAAVNLTAESLNLTATLIDPNNPPALPQQVSIDPDFPVVVEVEPTVALFRNSFESGQTGNGNLDFLNTYLFDIDTANLQCSSATSTYRLFKATHGSNDFADVTDDLIHGSVRARGRGGAFSRFMLVKDGRTQTLLGLPLIKLTNLSTRLLAATISNPALVANLTTLLTNVATNLVVLNVTGAISNLDLFIASVTNNAGGDIANEWNADRSLVNDAGELLSLAQTLRFSLTLLNGATVCN